MHPGCAGNSAYGIGAARAQFLLDTVSLSDNARRTINMKKLSINDQGAERNPSTIAHCLMGALCLLFVAAAISMPACHRQAAGIDYSKPCPLSASYSSLDDLGRATVKALNDNNANELEALMVTEQEYRDVIWPRNWYAGHQPDPKGFTWQDAWQSNAASVDGAIQRVLSEFGGERLVFQKTIVADTTIVLPQKTIYRDVRISVTAPDREQQFRFLNVVQEVEGRFKVVAFHNP